MTAWLESVPALVVAFAVLFGPGLIAGAGFRLRGLALWAFAPVASTAILAAVAIVFGFAGIPWSAWTVAAGGLAVAAVLAVAGYFVTAAAPRRPRHPRALWLLAAGLVIGIGLTAIRFMVYVGEPDAISQTNDAVFHLNAIRYIIETANASSLHVSGVLGARSFYPSAWHAVASVVALATGVSTPLAANVVSLVIAAVIWPLGIAFFAQRVSRGSAAVAASAAALSASLPAFPLLMFQWGVLYPYAHAVALVPAVAAITILAMRQALAPGVARVRSAVGATVLIGTGLLALALAQPAAILAWLVLSVTWFAWWAAQRLRGAGPRRRTGLIAGLAVVGLGAAGIWIVLSRSTSGAHWPPFRGKLEVLFDVVFNAPVALPAAVGTSILMVIGIVVAVRRRPLRWLATAWLMFAGLYIVGAAIGQPVLRRLLLGAFYADPYRIAALLPLTVIPLAAIGLVAVATWASAAIAERRGFAAQTLGTAWALAAVAVVGVVSFIVAPMIQLPRVTEGITDTDSRYRTQEFLSDDERALLERLPDHVEEGDLVIGNPSTGTGFGYLFSGIDVYPRTWAHPRSEPWTVISEDLRYAATEPEVCDALEVYGQPEYVLDFGVGESSPGRFELPGMTGFEGMPGFELVDSEGDASLWRITACAT